MSPTSFLCSLQKDINKTCRDAFPDFYGFVPMEKRRRTVVVCFACFMLSFVQLTAKAFACALCALESTTILMIYLSADMALMFAFKLARGDYTYWLPSTCNRDSSFRMVVFFHHTNRRQGNH